MCNEGTKYLASPHRSPLPLLKLLMCIWVSFEDMRCLLYLHFCTSCISFGVLTLRICQNFYLLRVICLLSLIQMYRIVTNVRSFFEYGSYLSWQTVRLKLFIYNG